MLETFLQIATIAIYMATTAVIALIVLSYAKSYLETAAVASGVLSNALVCGLIAFAGVLVWFASLLIVFMFLPVLILIDQLLKSL